MLEIIFPKEQELIGSLIAATPHAFHMDVNRAVLLITSRNRLGGYNAIQVNNPFLNRSSGFLNIKMLIGGPLNKHKMRLVHTPEVSWKNTKTVNKSVSTTLFDRRMNMLLGVRAPNKMFAAFGMFRWAAGQLEEEMAAGIWFNVPSDERILDEVLYDATIANRWYIALESAKLDVASICVESGLA